MQGKKKNQEKSGNLRLVRDYVWGELEKSGEIETLYLSSDYGNMITLPNGKGLNCRKDYILESLESTFNL